MASNKNIYTAQVISITDLNNNVVAMLARVYRVNGKTLAKAATVDAKDGRGVFKALQEKAGLAKKATITFKADGILEHQPGVDRVLPGKDGYGPTLLQRIAGLDYQSIQVTRWTKMMDLDFVDDAKANTTAPAEAPAA